MSQPQLKVEGRVEFILRYFLACDIGIFFSTEDDGESPEVPEADNFPKVLFG